MYQSDHIIIVTNTAGTAQVVSTSYFYSINNKDHNIKKKKVYLKCKWVEHPDKITSATI